MKKAAAVLALMIALAALAGCGDARMNNYDIAGTWRSASDHEHGEI